MLEICSTFFEYINIHNIRYCHWKSNSHLDKALEGRTDLDLLVHKEDKRKFNDALNKFDIKKINSPPEKRFPGLYDYLGFDQVTGKFIHLHVHYQLILGQKYIKNHHLPLECFFFNNLVLNEKNIQIPIPELELFILIIRYCMKFDIVSFLHYIRKRQLFPIDIKNEIKLLINQNNITDFRRIIKESNLKISENKLMSFINDFEKNTLNIKKVLKLRKYIFLKLKRFQRESGVRNNLKFLLINIVKFPYINKLFDHKKKTIGQKGKIYALVGADGSGKSTLIKDIKNWLAWKIEVKTIYLGIPKLKKLSCFSKMIKVTNLIEKSIKFRPITKLFSRLKDEMSGCRWIFVAQKRLEIIVAAQDYCKAGGSVISDRYPISDFNSMERPMDGPRIRKETTPVLLKKAIREEEYYSKFPQPDKIFVLQTDINELRKRKADLDINEHKKKADAINKMQNSENICIINGNKPYQNVLLDIKKKIWNIIDDSY